MQAHKGEFMSNDVTLGQYIAKRRKRIGLTQEELAKRLEGYGQYRAASTIAGWETDKQPVPLEFLDTLATALEENSPIKLYKKAGILAKLGEIGTLVEALDGLPSQDVRMVIRLARAYLEKENQ